MFRKNLHEEQQWTESTAETVSLQQKLYVEIVVHSLT